MSWFNELDAELRSQPTAAVLAVSAPRFRNTAIATGADIGVATIEALQARLSDRLHQRAIVRSWGHELFIVHPGIERLSDVSRLASEVSAAFDEPVACLEREVSITPAIGIALAPEDGSDLRELLSKAQIAADNAACLSNEPQLFAGDMALAVHRATMLEHALRDAVTNHALSLAFQPQLDVDAARFSSVEVLVRWMDPRLGVISPADFIPIAERAGLIPILGSWVLEEAARQIRMLHASVPDLELAVNVSPTQLSDSRFVLEVEETLRRTGLAPEKLTIEITEGLMLQDVGTACGTLEDLRSLGIRTAIDDFGAGFSNLGYLRRLPLDQLKIDRHFVNDLGQDLRAQTVLGAAIDLGHGLGLEVCAEGVETPAQLEALDVLGCDLIQGFLLARPAPIEELAVTIANGMLLLSAPAWPEATTAKFASTG